MIKRAVRKKPKTKSLLRSVLSYRVGSTSATRLSPESRKLGTASLRTPSRSLPTSKSRKMRMKRRTTSRPLRICSRTSTRRDFPARSLLSREQCQLRMKPWLQTSKPESNRGSRRTMCLTAERRNRVRTATTSSGKELQNSSMSMLSSPKWSEQGVVRDCRLCHVRV